MTWAQESDEAPDPIDPLTGATPRWRDGEEPIYAELLELLGVPGTGTGSGPVVIGEVVVEE